MSTAIVSAEDNKAFVRRFIEEYYNQGNLSLADQFVTADWVRSELFSPNKFHGVQGAKEVATKWRSAFPDLHLTVNEMIAEGQQVATYWTFTGTHQGQLDDIAPTGKKVTTSGISLSRIVNGKFTEEVVATDLLSLLKQLGVIPGN
ncbi:MAG TPA: ester cyclase [Pyrinomonadaceae bacterium]|nr:ester cyclase [Pyrinomonadaceae bacterium]